MGISVGIMFLYKKRVELKNVIVNMNSVRDTEFKQMAKGGEEVFYSCDYCQNEITGFDHYL